MTNDQFDERLELLAKKPEKVLGRRIGQAMARDVVADDMPREWTGLDPQDADQLPDGMDAALVAEFAEEAYEEIVLLVCGCEIYHDASGVDHCWRRKFACDLPADVRQEIEAAIVDGEVDACDYLASNGQHYRWANYPPVVATGERSD